MQEEVLPPREQINLPKNTSLGIKNTPLESYKRLAHGLLTLGHA